jgi:hypothetical protein
MEVTIYTEKEEFTHASFQSVSVSFLHKGKQLGVVGYYIFPLSMSDSSTATTSTPEIEELMVEFWVFQEPTSLPPVRDFDHTIPLKTWGWSNYNKTI